jgi:hypothetical protein
VSGLRILFGKNGRIRSICASVSRKRLLVITPVRPADRSTHTDRPQAEDWVLTLVEALEAWREDPAVQLAAPEPARRLRHFR